MNFYVADIKFDDPGDNSEAVLRIFNQGIFVGQNQVIFRAKDFKAANVVLTILRDFAGVKEINGLMRLGSSDLQHRIPEIEVGTVVSLNSSGPDMTVIRLGTADYESGSVECQWFNKMCEPYARWFVIAALTVANPAT